MERLRKPWIADFLTTATVPEQLLRHEKCRPRFVQLLRAVDKDRIFCASDGQHWIDCRFSPSVWEVFTAQVGVEQKSLQQLKGCILLLQDYTLCPSFHYDTWYLVVKKFSFAGAEGLVRIGEPEAISSCDTGRNALRSVRNLIKDTTHPSSADSSILSDLLSEISSPSNGRLSCEETATPASQDLQHISEIVAASMLPRSAFSLLQNMMSEWRTTLTAVPVELAVESASRADLSLLPQEEPDGGSVVGRSLSETTGVSQTDGHDLDSAEGLNKLVEMCSDLSSAGDASDELFSPLEGPLLAPSEAAPRHVEVAQPVDDESPSKFFEGRATDISFSSSVNTSQCSSSQSSQAGCNTQAVGEEEPTVGSGTCMERSQSREAIENGMPTASNANAYPALEDIPSESQQCEDAPATHCPPAAVSREANDCKRTANVVKRNMRVSNGVDSKKRAPDGDGGKSIQSAPDLPGKKRGPDAVDAVDTRMAKRYLSKLPTLSELRNFESGIEVAPVYSVRIAIPRVQLSTLPAAHQASSSPSAASRQYYLGRQRRTRSAKYLDIMKKCMSKLHSTT